MTLKKTALILFISALMVALIFEPIRYSKAVFDGLILFATNVLPVLFPFFFFTKILTELGVAEKIGKVFEKPLKKLYGVPSISAYIFAMSAMSGYPVGARLLADLYENGKLTTQECKKISSFASTSGPMFVVGTIGGYMLLDKKLGFLILFVHLASALLNGLVFRGKALENKINPTLPTISKDSDSILAKCIESSVSGILIVGAYIGIFNMLVIFLTDIRFFEIIATPIKLALLACGSGGADIVETVLISTIEVTRGALEISKLGLSRPLLVSLLSAAVSFGGLSVALQSITYLSKCKIKTGYYLLTKLSQCGISAILGYLVGML